MSSHDRLSLNDRSFCLIASLGGWGECPKATQKYNELTQKSHKAPTEQHKPQLRKPILKAKLITEDNDKSNKAKKTLVKDKKTKKTKRDYSISFSDVSVQSTPDIKKSSSRFSEAYQNRDPNSEIRKDAVNHIADTLSISRETTSDEMKQFYPGKANPKTIFKLGKNRDKVYVRSVNVMYRLIRQNLAMIVTNSENIKKEVNPEQVNKIAVEITKSFLKDSGNQDVLIASIEDVHAYFKQPEIYSSSSLEDLEDSRNVIVDLALYTDISLEGLPFKEIGKILDIVSNKSYPGAESDLEEDEEPAGVLAPGVSALVDITAMEDED